MIEWKENLKVATTVDIDGMTIDELINLLDDFSNEYPEAILYIEHGEIAIYFEEEDDA